MSTHKVGTREEHLAARLRLLEAEKDLTRREGCPVCSFWADNFDR